MTLQYKKVVASTLLVILGLNNFYTASVHADTTILPKNNVSNQVVKEDQDDPIIDDYLHQLINKQLGKSVLAPITKKELATITELNVDNQKIHSIEGLEYCTQLKTLKIGAPLVGGEGESNTISDISPLSKLTNLTILQAGKLQITDFSPLKNIIGNLRNFFSNLNCQTIVNENKYYNDDGTFSMKNPVKGLDGQTVPPKSISNNGVYDSTTNTIKWKNIQDEHLDLNFTFSIDTGSTVDINGTIKQAINKPISAKHEVNVPDPNLKAALNEELNEENINKITTRKSSDPLYKEDLGQLTNEAASTHFLLNSDGISDLTGLSACTKITYLNLANNSLSSIDELCKMPQLTGVDVSSNKLSDFSPFLQLPNICSIVLSHNNIKNVNGISKLKNLKTIKLDNNAIPDFSEVEEMSATQGLKGDLSNQKIIQQVTPTSTDELKVDNPLKCGKEKYIEPKNISNNGHYDETTHTICWDDVKGLKQVTVDFSDKTSQLNPSGTVSFEIQNTAQQAGQTKIEYTCTKTILSEPMWYGIVPATITMTDAAKESNADVQLVDADGAQTTATPTPYSGDKNIEVNVKSSNGYKLLDPAISGIDISYKLDKDGKGGSYLLEDQSEQLLGELNKKNTTINSTAHLIGKATITGKYVDTLNYHFIEK